MQFKICAEFGPDWEGVQEPHTWKFDLKNHSFSAVLCPAWETLYTNEAEIWHAAVHRTHQFKTDL